MKKVTIVYNKTTKKLIPFEFGDLGEVILLDGIKEDNLVVSNVDPQRLDLYNGYLLEEGEVYVEKEDYKDIYGVD